MNHPAQKPQPQQVLADRFESDTRKIVRQHLRDKNHIITEADIANVRIGVQPTHHKLLGLRNR